MRRTKNRLGAKWGVRPAWVVGLGALLGLAGIGEGCLSEPGPARQLQREQRAAIPAPVSVTCEPAAADPKAPVAGAAPSRLALAPRDTWQRIDAPGGWALSPRFVDDSLVLLSGRLGRGRFLADARGAVHVVDADYRGPVKLRGRVLCLPNRATVSQPPALPGGLRLAGAGTCPPGGTHPELGRVLHESDGGRWIFYGMLGELVYRPLGEASVLVENRVPYSIRVSPDGRRVAYILGTITNPTLVLWDATHGKRVLGAGVYPVFHPDGLLLYGRPRGKRRLGSITTVASSELRAHDLATGESWNLTDTPDLDEMEPALSPDGNRLVFSDWRGGGAYRVTLWRAPARQGVVP